MLEEGYQRGIKNVAKIKFANYTMKDQPVSLYLWRSLTQGKAASYVQVQSCSVF